MIRCVVADDQALVRGGFRVILDLQPDIEVVAEAADGREAVQKVRQHQPDVVLMDIQMPDVDGLEATRQILSRPVAPRILVLTTFDTDEYVHAALRSGASGFLLKDVPPEALADAVRTVHAGVSLLSPDITRRLVEDHRVPLAPGEVPEGLEQLTTREREVLVHIARGLSNGEIATALYIGDATVKTHINRIMAKLGLRDRAQAVVLAYECGLVRPGV